MARALMTPDELRRMDNDLCIIFEKGIKPVKANKFYYFKHPMAKELAKYKISHNDIGEIDRGVWRKYNPYNPYVEEKDDKTVDNLNIESLDDLFDDTDNKKDDAPILPQYDNNEDDGYDLQKELEAKFDELFGPLDDE